MCCKNRDSLVAADAVTERHYRVELPRVGVIEAEHVAQKAHSEQRRELRARQTRTVRGSPHTHTHSEVSIVS